jgi:hypothetical protein
LAGFAADAALLSGDAQRFEQAGHQLDGIAAAADLDAEGVGHLLAVAWITGHLRDGLHFVGGATPPVTIQHAEPFHERPQADGFGPFAALQSQALIPWHQQALGGGGFELSQISSSG